MELSSSPTYLYIGSNERGEDVSVFSDPQYVRPRFIYTPEVLTCFITPQLAALYTTLTGQSSFGLTKGELARRLANRPLYIPSSFFPYFLLGAYVTTPNREILITSPSDLQQIQGTGTISHFATKLNRRFNSSFFTPCSDEFYSYQR